jgi:hypothetical protein
MLSVVDQEKAITILKELVREYNQDELCSYRKINELIEQADDFLRSLYSKAKLP